ncbi:4Fe-4S binding protein [Geomonas sp. Red32]|uniref:4Fe-4S binding protein n=1 Tax=Geomonas sp. Red32 TaxID=2912856 RepID=UPI00202CC782|nr:4Fe-4S binding protein [Geomonas sp. Red32]MCM0081299.1 4Fe-4S binding protein [Geomonas sp. Red32]
MSDKRLQRVRLIVQWSFLFFSLYLGVAFYQFVLHFRSNAPFVERPDGVEAFLPISGLMSLKVWMVTGKITTIHPAALVMFLAAILVSLFFKRSFCSWICPVSTFTEVLWKSGQAVMTRNFQVWRPLDWLLRPIKYILMALFLIAILVVMSPDNVNSFLADDFNKIADVKMLDFFLNLGGIGLFVITSLFFLSFFFRNPFCRFLCPYGALLGLVSRLSPVKVERNASACISCGGCNKACPSHIEVMKKERVCSEECIGCLRCVSACPKPEALKLKAKNGKVVPGVVFGALVVVVFVGSSLVARATGHWHTSVTRGEYQDLIYKLDKSKQPEKIESFH